MDSLRVAPAHADGVAALNRIRSARAPSVVSSPVTCRSTVAAPSPAPQLISCSNPSHR